MGTPIKLNQYAVSQVSGALLANALSDVEDASTTDE